VVAPADHAPPITNAAQIRPIRKKYILKFPPLAGRQSKADAIL